MLSFLILSIQKKKNQHKDIFEAAWRGKIKQDVENKRQPSPHLHFLLLKDMK